MEKHLSKTLRQEKKYLFHRQRLNYVEQKLISMGFKVNHDPNFVNNIYLDNFFNSAAIESIEGDAIREKFRIRWYNNSNSYTLESKIRLSSSGYKNKKKLYGLLLNDAVKEAEKITTRRSIIQNQYFRRYYIRDDIRITLDSQLKFSLPKSNIYKNYKFCVMEIKYNTEFQPFCDQLNENLFQLTKFSKYLEGLKSFNLV